MTRFHVHPAFFLVVLLAFLHGFWLEVLLLFVIVLIHELGHACTAKSFGWRVKKIELLPLGGVAEMEEHGNRPLKEEFLVIIAGPLLNVIMIIFGFICLQAGLWDAEFAYLFVEYNLIIFIFNLLPIHPLDGGKIMQVLCSLFLPYKRAIHYSLWISIVCLLLFMIGVLLYVPYYFTLWVMAIFLCTAQYLEWKQRHYQFLRFLLERYRYHQQSSMEVFPQDIRGITLLSQQPLKEAIERLYRHKWHYFWLLNREGQIQHMISEAELLEAYFEHQQVQRSMEDVFPVP